MTSLNTPFTDLRPISDRTRQNYLNAFKTVRNASVAKRTTDKEEPALVTLTQIVEDYVSRADQANSTRAVTRSAILWIIKSGQVEFTSTDMMCSGDRHDKNPKELHGRVQT